jgi:uncharacterized protein
MTTPGDELHSGSLDSGALDSCALESGAPGTELLSQWPQFSEEILALLRRLGLDGLQLACDHVALRVNTVAGAEALKDYFCRGGRIISNNMINGRPILIIELDEPLRLGAMSIDCVELPYPGDKHYPREGWEHIELVLPAHDDNSHVTDCDTLVANLLALQPALAQIINAAGESGIGVKLSSPKGENERLPNPTIAFKSGSVCIKVHPHGIKAILASEQGQ